MPRAPRRIAFDLHGYDVLGALDAALEHVADAYRNGYEEVTLIHGAANVTEPVAVGRGRIKWELRRLFDEGGFDGYVDRDGCWPRERELVLKLRRNPSPRPERWSDPPHRRHR